ncbi:MAG: ABC-2 type transport system ATP-binding protein [Candidatus Nanohaloarchaea archaeon]|jgi:ABC-2 type transport system ATP-binding protein
MPAIELEDVEKSYGDFPVLKGLSLSVEEGEIFGILGPNGVGKTTLFQTVIGLLRPDAGSIKIDGEEHDHGKEIKRKISYLPADISFYEDMTARKNLEFFAELTEEEPDIEELLELVNLESDAKRKVGDFSTGMKKRLGIAQSLIKDPEIIIYDEPTTGLDPQGKKQFKDLAKKVNSERGKTLLISSHITTEIDSLCDRFAILKDGKVVESGTREELSGIEGSEINIIVETENQDEASEVLEKNGFEFSQDGKDIRVTVEEEHRSEIFDLLVENNTGVRKIELEEESLETTYLRLTGEEE